MPSPLASIIIPVAAAHARHAATALNSCRWQTLPQWEAIVVNDTGKPLRIEGDTRIRVIDAPEWAYSHTPRRKNRASVARNAGIEVARGTFLIFLDADDYLLPSALETFVRGHARHEAAYSYSHHYGLSRAGEWAHYRPPEYNRMTSAEIAEHRARDFRAQTIQEVNLHPITAFVPAWCVRDVGGFDEDAPGLEDWTIWLRLAMAGHCGERIYGPTFVYRRDEGVNHIPDIAGGQALMDAVLAPYRDATGDIPMAGCGCGGGARTAKDAARMLAQRLGGPALTESGLITLEYIGKGDGKQSFRHPLTGREIRAGRGPAVRYVQVNPEEVAWLTQELKFFAAVPPPAPFVDPPEIAPVGVAAVHAGVETAHEDALDDDGRPSKTKKERAKA